MARASWIGETLGGRYKIEKLLGKGGMSAVYQAADPNLRRVVAVKLIHTHLSDDPAFVSRFMAEAATVAQLRHPNIIQVFDFNHDEDTYYIVFEFVPGETLQDRLKRLNADGRKMSINEALTIIASVADALEYAHSRDLVHRDVKPANVMLNVHNEPILMDFGIVKIVGGTTHTATGATLGTARYMAPEQIRGENVDRRTDIYALGVMLYEMLAGRAPFEADSVMTMMMMHVTDPVPNLSRFRPEIPPQLRQIVEKALSKDPQQRFQTAREFATALRQVDLSAPPPPVAATAAATVVEPLPAEVMEMAARTGQAPPAMREEASPPPPATPVAPAASGEGSRRTPFVAAGIGGAILLLLLVCVVGAYALNSFANRENDPQETPLAAADLTATAGAEDEADATPTSDTADATPIGGGGDEEEEATATSEPAATATSAPAATNTSAPTNTPTATATATSEPSPPPPPSVTPLPELYVQITDITIENGQYVVDYVTYGYTEQLPGQHVHFFFNTVPPEQAGNPGSGPWILYGGPRPFTQYGVGDRPAAATAMCALVANNDHSVIADSGNCMDLPS